MKVLLSALSNGTDVKFSFGGCGYTLFVPKQGMVDIPHESGQKHFLVSKSGIVTHYELIEYGMNPSADKFRKTKMPDSIFAKVVRAVVKNFDRNTTIEVS